MQRQTVKLKDFMANLPLEVLDQVLEILEPSSHKKRDQTKTIDRNSKIELIDSNFRNLQYVINELDIIQNIYKSINQYDSSHLNERKSIDKFNRYLIDYAIQHRKPEVLTFLHDQGVIYNQYFEIVLALVNKDLMRVEELFQETISDFGGTDFRALAKIMLDYNDLDLLKRLIYSYSDNADFKSAVMDVAMREKSFPILKELNCNMLKILENESIIHRQDKNLKMDLDFLRSTAIECLDDFMHKNSEYLNRRKVKALFSVEDNLNQKAAKALKDVIEGKEDPKMLEGFEDELRRQSHLKEIYAALEPHIDALHMDAKVSYRPNNNRN